MRLKIGEELRTTSLNLKFTRFYNQKECIASNRRIIRIMAGAKKRKKKNKSRLSTMNYPDCDIAIPSLVFEQHLIISMKIYVRK